MLSFMLPSTVLEWNANADRNKIRHMTRKLAILMSRQFDNPNVWSHLVLYSYCLYMGMIMKCCLAETPSLSLSLTGWGLKSWYILQYFFVSCLLFNLYQVFRGTEGNISYAMYIPDVRCVYTLLGGSRLSLTDIKAKPFALEYVKGSP